MKKTLTQAVEFVAEKGASIAIYLIVHFSCYSKSACFALLVQFSLQIKELATYF